MLAADIETETNHKMINIGSCGLHHIHNAFRTASNDTGWDMEPIPVLAIQRHLLSEMISQELHTGSTVFPKRFCKHR